MKYRWAAAILVAGALIGAGLWAASTVQIRFRQQAVTLPDGSFLTLRKVSYGTNHVGPGTILQEILAKFPAFIRAKFPAPMVSRVTTPEPALAVWLEGPANAQFALRSLNESGGEAGFEGASIYAGAPSATRALHGIASYIFPRQLKVFRIRVYQRNPQDWSKLNRVAEFTIRNPRPIRTLPEWKPEPLPLTRTNGELAFTLEKVWTGVLNSTPVAPAGEFDDPYARLVFRISKNGQPFDQWEPKAVQLHDPQGNHASAASWNSGSEQGLETFTFRPSLWPDEPWRLQVEFARKPTAEFGPAELIRVPAIEIPARDGYTSIHFSTDVLGYIGQKIEVIGLAGPNGKVPGGNRFTSGSYSLEVKTTAFPKKLRLTLVRLKENTGKEAQAQGSGWTDTDYSFDFRFSPEAKKVDLTLAVQKTIFLDFVVKPEQFKTNGAAEKLTQMQ